MLSRSHGGAHGRIEWFDGTFEEALASAAKQRKIVFVDFFMDTCPPCLQLDRITFSETSVKEEARSFVCVAVDATSETGRPLAERYGIASWPSLVFVEPDGTLRDRLVGFRNAGDFVRELHRVQSGIGTLGEIERRLVANPADVVARLDLVARLRSYPDDRWAVEMERARAGIEKGEGFDPKSPDDRYAIARRLAACGDKPGAEAQRAAIRALDPEGKSAASRHLALDALLARRDTDVDAIRAFLEGETHASVLFEGFAALRDGLERSAALYEKQNIRPMAFGRRSEARAAAKEAWKRCPPDRAAEIGLKTALEFAAVPAELDADDRAFAVEVASRASSLLPSSVDHLEALATCLEIDGRKDEALEALRRAAAIDPTRPSLRARLERAPAK
jgi:thiol-disulfide isomerase/thioredoxin